MKLYYYMGLCGVSEVTVVEKDAGPAFCYCEFENGRKDFIDKNYLFKTKEMALEYAVKALKERAKYSEAEVVKAQRIHQNLLGAISSFESELCEMKGGL
jgi:hypothetical protein